MKSRTRVLAEFDVYTKAQTDGKVVELSPPTDLSDYYTKAQTDSNISALIGNAPASMDTLAEIADSLGDDPDYATNLNIQAMNTAASIIDLQDKYITEHV